MAEPNSNDPTERSNGINHPWVDVKRHAEDSRQRRTGEEATVYRSIYSIATHKKKKPCGVDSMGTLRLPGRRAQIPSEHSSGAAKIALLPKSLLGDVVQAPRAAPRSPERSAIERSERAQGDDIRIPAQPRGAKRLTINLPSDGSYQRALVKYRPSSSHFIVLQASKVALIRPFFLMIFLVHHIPP